MELEFTPTAGVDSFTSNTWLTCADLSSLKECSLSRLQRSSKNFHFWKGGKGDLRLKSSNTSFTNRSVVWGEHLDSIWQRSSSKNELILILASVLVVSQNVRLPQPEHLIPEAETSVTLTSSRCKLNGLALNLLHWSLSNALALESNLCPLLPKEHYY